MTTSTDQFTDRLDALEDGLPPIPAKTLQLTRASVRRTNEVVTSVADRIGDAVEPVVSTLTTATRTVAGQARSAAERSARMVRRGANETIGQAGAQAGRVADAARRETEDALDDAVDAVAPEPRHPASLENLSKSELYDRAQAAAVEGRSAMSKAELIEALRAR